MFIFYFDSTDQIEQCGDVRDALVNPVVRGKFAVYIDNIGRNIGAYYYYSPTCGAKSYTVKIEIIDHTGIAPLASAEKLFSLQATTQGHKVTEIENRDPYRMRYARDFYNSYEATVSVYYVAKCFAHVQSMLQKGGVVRTDETRL